MKKLRYGNTNTFYISGAEGGLLIDTDYAGTLPRFFKAIKAACIDISDITYMLATHYHPDHIGIVSELQMLGITLLIVDVQKSSVHFADEIFFRDKRLDYKPIDESMAKVIGCAESRSFLRSIGISGEIILSLDNFRERTGCPKTIVEKLVKFRILEGLPESNQLSIFANEFFSIFNF